MLSFFAWDGLAILKNSAAMTASANVSSEKFSSAESWFTFWRFGLLLALLIFALFPDVLLGQRTFFYRDFPICGYSWASFHRTSFWRGEFPLWNPLSNCGVPFLAQWNTIPLYPLSLFYLVLPLSFSLGVFCLLHLWIAGMGMYYLAFRWTEHRLGAAIAGMAFAFSGLMFNSLAWPNNIGALAWMPWLAAWCDAALRDKRAIAPAALIAALQMLTGAPEIIFQTWIFLSALWLRECFQSKRFVPQFPVVVLLVAALSAIQLLPFLDLVAHSQRDKNFADASLWPMPTWGLANFLVPLFFHFPWSLGVFFQYDQYWTTSYYVGIGTLLLALMALKDFRRGPILFLAIMLALSLVLAMGERAFLFGWLRQLLPLLSFMRYPVKFVVLSVFLLPLLAAFGARFVSATDPRRLLLASSALLLLAIGMILWFARFHPLYEGDYNQWPATFQSGLTRAALLLIFAFAFGTVRKINEPRLAILVGLTILLTVWFDLQTHEPSPSPTIARGFYSTAQHFREWPNHVEFGKSRAITSFEAETKLHEAAMQKPNEDFMRRRLGLYSNLNLIEEIPKATGVFSLQIREADQFSRLLYATNSGASNLLDFIGVSEISAPGKTIEWTTRLNFMPLLSSGQKPVFLDDRQTFDAMAKGDFDPRQTVFLPREAKDAVTATNGAMATIVPRQIGMQKIEADVQSSAPAIVVIAQNHYHWWRAELDGRLVPVWRANYAFQAVEIPAGRHELRLVYRDRSFVIGAGISIGGVLICIALWLSNRRRSVNA